eukprot:1898929-Prymnesium_polylepis.2
MMTPTHAARKEPRVPDDEPRTQVLSGACVTGVRRAIKARGSPAELYRPSRLLMTNSGGLSYIPKDL